MKTIFALSLLFFTIAGVPLFAALTPEDLDKIRLIVKAEVAPIKADVEALKTDRAVVKTEITNLKENLKNGFDTVEKDFDTVEKDFDTVQKNFDRQNNIIIACIGIPLAILALGATVWGILTHRRSRKEDSLEKQIETLTQEIETLKRKQIVHP